MDRKLSATIAAAALVAQAGPAAGREKPEKEAIVLQPSSQWSMNVAEDSCHLARRFGQGDGSITAEFRQFGQSNDFYLVLAGKPLEIRGQAPLQIAFEPFDAHEPNFDVIGGKLANGHTLVQLPSSFRPNKTDDTARPNPEEYARVVPDRVAEASVETLAISGPFANNFRLALGPMDKPMDAMRSCVAGLLEKWGLDVGAHLTLSRRAIPTNSPANWLSGRDYPKQQLMNSSHASVQFRLMVDAQGTPYDCKVPTALGDDVFEKTTCQLLMRRAKFSPALDSKGRAIPSYYINSVLWRAS
jgi:hypothetical protein